MIEYDLTRQRDIPALPNLEFRVVAGDSLVDRVGSTAFLLSLPQSYVQLDLETQDVLRQLDLAITRYREADEQGNLRQVRRQGEHIRSLQRQIATRQLERTIREARARRNNLERASRPSRRRIEAATAELRALEQMEENLRLDLPVQKPLLWPLVFRDVFVRGGFDIAVANPPYVRQESISPIDQQAY